MWLKCVLMACFMLSIEVQAQVNEALMTEFVDFLNGLDEDVKDNLLNAIKKFFFGNFLSMNFYYEIDCNSALNSENMTVEWEWPAGNGQQPLNNSWLTKLTVDQCNELKDSPTESQPNWRGEMRIVNPSTKQAYLKIGANNEMCGKQALTNSGQHPLQLTVYAIVGLTSAIFFLHSAYFLHF